MLKSTTKFATLAIAGTLLVGGSVLKVNAESAYNSTAVAGIALSVNNYVSSIEDTAPAVSQDQAATEQTQQTTQEEKKEKHPKLVVANVENVVNVRKKGSTDAKIVGQMYKGDAGKIVKKGKNWSKIKSGNVVGWVKNEFLLFGDKAYAHAKKICPQVATVNTTTLNVRSAKNTKADVVTQIPKGGEYTVKKTYDGWYKISVDEDCKGYVSADYVDVDVEYGEALTMKEIREIEEANKAAEEAEQQAAAEQQMQQNAAASQQTQTATQTQTASANVSQSVTSKTITSSQSVSTIKPTRKSSSASSSSKSSSVASNNSGNSSFSNDSSVSSTSTSTGDLGSKIASYATQFVGNPYVYGGTSLTNGTDCSGFTMSVYAHFGYSISRTAAAQSGNGTSVSFSNLQPGDLVFYKNGGGIGHVALYIGGGQVVHASNPKSGIKISSYNYRTPCKAVRIIK